MPWIHDKPGWLRFSPADRWTPDEPHENGGVVIPTVTAPPAPTSVLPKRWGSDRPVRYEFTSLLVAGLAGKMELNQKFAEGWEPHSQTPMGDGVLFVLKRAKP